MSELQTTLTAAVNAVSAQGYISPEQLEYWLSRLRRAAEKDLGAPEKLQAELQRVLKAIYARQVEQGAILAGHNIPRFKLQQLAVPLRRELDRRIMASVSLIRLNRTRAIDQSLQRFAGWATSITPGGAENVDRVEEKQRMRKSVYSASYEERRVLTDQGHKLVANLNNIIAQDGGAIAVEWRSNFQQPGYNFRVEHAERHGKIYLLPDSWAVKAGLVKPGAVGWYTDVTAFAEEPYCRCRGRYIYFLSGLPDDMLTEKGREFKARAKAGLMATD